MFYLLEPDDIVDGEDLESEVLAAGTVATQAHTGEGAWGEVFQQCDKVSGSESLSINIEAISLEPLVEGLLGTGAVVKIHATESNIPYAGIECIDVLFFYHFALIVCFFVWLHAAGTTFPMVFPARRILEVGVFRCCASRLCQKAHQDAQEA